MAISKRWRTAIAGGAAFLAVSIGGIVVAEAINGPSAERDDAQEVVAAGNEDALSLRVGDCFDNVEAEEFAELPLVPCAEPHDNEIFHAFELEGESLPDAAGLETAALAECDPAYEAYIGVGYADSTLDWWFIQPTEQGWNELDDRVMQCVVFDPAGKVEGSLAGTQR